jgi:glycosyltransferase involved in cell wall biosynthesis
VVDNDDSASAAPICEEAAKKYALKIACLHEPKPGIPQARNRVLDSLPDGCEGLAWIDDDETPAPGWLESLLLTHKGTGADIVLGSVEAILPDSAPAWVKKGGFFNRRRFIDRASLTEGAADGCLMQVNSIRHHNMRFDESLGNAGSADTLFLRWAEKQGLRMVWSPEALIREHIAPDRCRLGWLVKKHFRSGITLAICDTKLDGFLGGHRRFWLALSKLAQGILNLPIGFEGMHELTRALLMLSRGCGMLAGLAGVRLR